MTHLARLRHGVVTVLALLVLLPSAVLLAGAAFGADEPTDAPTTDPSEQPSDGTSEQPSDGTTAPETETGAFTVDDAQFRWGINNESNNRAFAPGTFNFPSAGEAPDPGKGAQTVSLSTGRWSSNGKRAWLARAGSVRIEKLNAAGTYDLATLAGLDTDANGVVIPNTWGNDFSGHQVVIDGGTGEVDPGSGTARISWNGTFTVFYYSGMSFFFVSDPELVVTRTSARITATLGGYRSSMDDLTKWERATPRTVVLADLSRNDIRLSAEGGFTVTPRYRGVQLKVSGDAPAQVRTGADWGSFPQSFVGYVNSLGSGAYWYSSGGSADPHKVALPVSVSYSAGDPVDVPAPPQPSTTAAATPTVSTAPSPPPVAPAQPAEPVPTNRQAQRAAPQDQPATAAPATVDPRMPSVPVAYALAAGDRKADPLNSSHPWEWWLGSLLLLGAAAMTLLSSTLAKGKR